MFTNYFWQGVIIIQTTMIKTIFINEAGHIQMLLGVLLSKYDLSESCKQNTSSPSHWQQVEEQAPKPVGWTMCFLLMTLVPVQKLCVNIYVYICVYIPYTSSVIGRIYNGSVIQYWRSCTPSRFIGECAVPDLNAILCFLWFTNCVLLFDNNLILGCLWHCVFV